MSSVRRKETQYLETALDGLLCGLSADERNDLYLTVFIAEANPDSRPSWRQEWRRDNVDEVYTYHFEGQKRDHVDKLQREGGFSEEGAIDYIVALQRCYETGTPYIGMFEDDIVLTHGWLIRPLSGLRRMPFKTSRDNSRLLLRLFNQERSTGWANYQVGGNYEFWIVRAIALAVSAPLFLARRRWVLFRKSVDPVAILLLVAVTTPVLVVLFFQSGKASMLPPSPGVFKEPFGCCSQALVFPRQQVLTISHFLRIKQSGQVDLLLNELARGKPLSRYALYPVQAQHIGLDFTRNTEKTEAQAIWSMAFEKYDPKCSPRATNNWWQITTDKALRNCYQISLLHYPSTRRLMITERMVHEKIDCLRRTEPFVLCGRRTPAPD